MTRDADWRVLAFAPALPDWWVIDATDGVARDGKRIVWHERLPILGWLTVEVDGTTEVHAAIDDRGGQPTSVYAVYGDETDDRLYVTHTSQLKVCTCGRVAPYSPPDAWWCRECAALIPGSPELPGLNTA